MPINGQKFLYLNKRESLIVTDHALDRIADRVGRHIGYEKALEIFGKSTQVKYEELLAMGYRPSVGKHVKRGYTSWYFRATIDTYEMIIVVSNCKISESLIWVTTYFPNKLSNNFKVLDFDDLRMGK